MGLILVDSSVWIDRFADRQTRHTLAFERLLLAKREIAIGDLMVVEVLQGVRNQTRFDLMHAQLAVFTSVRISDHRIAVQAARHYRQLRESGITPRKTIDTLIATRCILDRLPLLYSDRDFDPFVEHLGLQSALDLLSGAN